MVKLFRFLSIFLLLFNGVNALGGGWLLMVDPSGAKIQMPLHWLEHAPFDNYFIPGIILFITNGLLSIMIAIITIFSRHNYARLVVCQGCILVVWIIVQAIMLQMIYFLHFILGGLGVLLVLLGIILNRIDPNSNYRLHV